jgi:hypothetical protein
MERLRLNLAQCCRNWARLNLLGTRSFSTASGEPAIPELQ